MTEIKIVPQRKFETLEEFVRVMDNFPHIFIKDSDIGKKYREKIPAFDRFKNKYPVFNHELTETTTRNYGENKELPVEQIFIGYELMWGLVHERDEYTPNTCLCLNN